jgi:DNA-binding FadR family transcriptional regulator
VMDVSRDQVRRWLKHFQARGRIVFREGGGR